MTSRLPRQEHPRARTSHCDGDRRHHELSTNRIFGREKGVTEGGEVDGANRGEVALAEARATREQEKRLYEPLTAEDEKASRWVSHRPLATLARVPHNNPPA